MTIEEVKTKVNEDRERLEASFVFCLWKNPSLYDDYKDISKDTLITKDAQFYYYLGKGLRESGLNTFDNLSVDTFLSTRPETKKRYESYGGWKEIEQLKDLTSEENVTSYFDQINKCNYLVTVFEKYTTAYEKIPALKKLSCEDIYMLFDNINTSSSLVNNQEIQVSDMTITDDDVESYKRGEAVGVNYNKAYPLLNYTTLGLPRGDVTLVSGHSGTGKSSFVFNMFLGIVKDEIETVGILSNEMQITAYKHMLIAHVLTEELDYYKVTRKKLKQGKWSDEEDQMIRKAQQIINEKYAKRIFFVKLFGNNSSVVMREMKRLNRKYGTNVFCWDTYKGDDTTANEIWLELLMNSRKIFNLVAKENWSLVLTFQLALYTTNQRWLDAGCLSNSKQIKEIVSEHIMLRKLWWDEYSGEKYDCKPYKLENNKPVYLTLDKDKLYVVAFIDKTRNDDNAKCILYKWDSVWNKWLEIGYCTIVNDHKGI